MSAAPVAVPGRRRPRPGARHAPRVGSAIKRRLVNDLIAEFDVDPFGAAARGEALRHGLAWFRGE